MTNSSGPLQKNLSDIKTILVVEDDPDIGELLVEILRNEASFHAILANDGFQALKIVNAIKPDLFVLDYQLPQMDGLELYDHLHILPGLERIPTLFMSANMPTNELEKRHISLIKKPFELEELLQTIESLLVTENASQ